MREYIKNVSGSLWNCQGCVVVDDDDDDDDDDDVDVVVITL